LTGLFCGPAQGLSELTEFFAWSGSACCNTQYAFLSTR
jgi:hypothetical protein